MSNPQALLLSGLLLFLSTGCASLVSAQRAETLGEGGSEGGVAGSATGVVATGNGGGSQFFPRVDFAGRWGVSDRVDLGGRVGVVFITGSGGGLGLGATGQLKHQLTALHGKGLIVSIAPAVGGATVVAFNNRGGASGVEISVDVPLLFGIPIEGGHEFVFGPHAINFFELSTGSGGGNVDIFALGGEVGFSLELTRGIHLMPHVGFSVPVVGSLSFGGGSSSGTLGNGLGLQLGVGLTFGSAGEKS